MNYIVCKLKFSTGVHFGNGMLNDTGYTFGADTLFSALYIEAIKLNEAERFKEMVLDRRLRLSDAFPYIGEQLMLPKPVLYIETRNQGDSVEKKKYKKLKYIPVEEFKTYINGNMVLEKNPMDGYGCYERQTMAAVRRQDDTLPFHVGVWRYAEGNGLYVIVGYEHNEELELLKKLFKSLSYSGIGGKKNSGLGRFETEYIKPDVKLMEKLTLDAEEGKTYMLLSRALPKDNELSEALKDASYLLEKRSGFVYSSSYAPEERKKRDKYVFASGSCFTKTFSGDLYDVSDGGKHPVYLYAMPLFMEVERDE